MLESFNTDFCDTLNAYLIKALQHCDHPIARGCSMDGILMPFIDSHTSKKHIHDVRKLETHAWTLTNNGSVKFALIVYFGKYALRRYAKGSLLDDCLPALDYPGAVTIDFENEIIEVRLL